MYERQKYEKINSINIKFKKCVNFMILVLLIKIKNNYKQKLLKPTLIARFRGNFEKKPIFLLNYVEILA